MDSNHLNSGPKDNFPEMFVELIDSMVDYANFSRERLVTNLCQMARFFNLSKVVTEFYKSITDEKDGKGEILCDYNEGPADKVVMKKELLAKTGAIVRATAYAKEGTAPLSKEEEKQIDICLRALMSYVGRNRLQTAVEVLAYHDASGYPNLAYYFRHLEKMSRMGSFDGYTAIMYNLKQFGAINRDIGVEGGNAVMKGHFDALNALIGDEGVLCRVGGDNFAAIFPNELMEKVLSFLEGTEVKNDNEVTNGVNLSAYVGVFIIPREFKYERPGNIVEMIMPACMAAKASNEGDVYYATLKDLEAKENESRVRRHFTQALEKGEFQAFYQPKVSVKTGKIVGAEALCRWIRNGKTIPPMEFIPILEKHKDINRLDYYMLTRVCKDIRKWLGEGRDIVRISVNFSRKDLVEQDILEKVVDILRENDVPHKYIEIELTETTSEGDYQKLKKLVEDFKAVGIHTSIDDFGVGYSSLNIIRELPWDVMKIDRSLLPETDSEKVDSSTGLYKHIAAMASDMGIECLTEGVESQEQVKILKENSCAYAQGFYYDKPLPREEFEKRMEIGEYPVE